MVYPSCAVSLWWMVCSICCQPDAEVILITPPLFLFRWVDLREYWLDFSETWWEDGQWATEGAITFGLDPDSKMNLNLRRFLESSWWFVLLLCVELSQPLPLPFLCIYIKPLPKPETSWIMITSITWSSFLSEELYSSMTSVSVMAKVGIKN